MAQQGSPVGKVFFEVGTGWSPMVPIAYWLMGADRIITIDLNPYLKEELVAEHLRCIADEQDKIAALFGDLMVGERFQALLELANRPAWTLNQLLDLCRIDYVAPGDAGQTGLPDSHVDFHTSFTVLEHIPPDVLSKIFMEGNRITRDNGLFVHYVDYSDHFSHADKRISAINFLQFSDDVWASYADNRYMYMNRLRHDDFLALYERAGHQIVDVEPSVDRLAEQLLQTGALKLDSRFESKTKDVLAITGAWIVTRQALA